MITLMNVAPQDRWSILESTLNQMLNEKEHASTISPTALMNVADLAQTAHVTPDTLLKTLEKGGAMPFRMGKAWMVREINLVTFYQNAERQNKKAR